MKTVSDNLETFVIFHAELLRQFHKYSKAKGYPDLIREELEEIYKNGLIWAYRVKVLTIR